MDQQPDLRQAAREAHFVPMLHRHPAGVFAAVLITCFRADGGVLMLRRAGPGRNWDMPHGPIPSGRGTPARLGPLASDVLYELSGVRPAGRPVLYGMIDWGPTATRAGWGWTACLMAEVGSVDPLPPDSWAGSRAFLSPERVLDQLPADSWGMLRRDCLVFALTAFDETRDFWLLQPLDPDALAGTDTLLE